MVVKKEMSSDTVIESFAPTKDEPSAPASQAGTPSPSSAASFPTPTSSSSPTSNPVPPIQPGGPQGLFGNRIPMNIPKQAKPAAMPPKSSTPGVTRQMNPAQTPTPSPFQPKPSEPPAAANSTPPPTPRNPFEQPFPTSPNVPTPNPILNPVPFPQAAAKPSPEPISPPLSSTENTQAIPLAREMEKIQALNEQYQKEIEQLKDQIHTLEANNEGLLARIQALTDEHAKVTQAKDVEINQYKQLFSKADQEKIAYQKLMAEYQAKDKDFQELSQKFADLQDQLKFVNEQNQNSQSIIAKQQDVIREISQKNAVLDDTIEQLTREKEELKVALDQELEKQIPELRENLDEMEEQNEVLAKTIEKYEGKVKETQDLAADLEGAQIHIVDLENKNDELYHENNELKARLAKIENELAAMYDDFDFDDEDFDSKPPESNASSPEKKALPSQTGPESPQVPSQPSTSPPSTAPQPTTQQSASQASGSQPPSAQTPPASSSDTEKNASPPETTSEKDKKAVPEQ